MPNSKHKKSSTQTKINSRRFQHLCIPAAEDDTLESAWQYHNLSIKPAPVDEAVEDDLKRRVLESLEQDQKLHDDVESLRAEVEELRAKVAELSLSELRLVERLRIADWEVAAGRMLRAKVMAAHVSSTDQQRLVALKLLAVDCAAYSVKIK